MSNAGLRVDSVTIIGANGRQTTLPVGQTIAAGGRTPAFNVPWHAGAIRSVQVNYTVPRSSRTPSTFRGHHGTPAVPQITVLGLG